MARLAPGMVIADRYRLDRVVGRGAFGAVYAAEHVMTGHKVAIKVLTMAYEGTDDPAYVRFMREASVTARLSDPHTVRVSDVGRAEDGTPYIAMEFLPGDTLADRIEIIHANKGAFSEADVVELGVAVCRSLSEAHGMGLVHRDLKPANIIYAQLGAREVIKVVDFGIAQTADSELTKTGVALGTPQYMSPEQLQGFELDGRSDVFGLGVILYVCLTGQLPFPGDSAMDVAMVQRDTRPKDVLKASTAAISTDLARTIHRAIAVRREDRFQSADELRKALERLFRKTGNARDKLLRDARGGVEEDDFSTRALPGKGSGQPAGAPADEQISDSLSTPLLGGHARGRLPRRRVPAVATSSDEKATALIDIDVDALPLSRGALGSVLQTNENRIPEDAATAKAMDVLDDDYVPPSRRPPGAVAKKPLPDGAAPTPAAKPNARPKNKPRPSSPRNDRRAPRGRPSSPGQPRARVSSASQPAPQAPEQTVTKPVPAKPRKGPSTATPPVQAGKIPTTKASKGPSTGQLVAMAVAGGVLVLGALIAALYAMGVFA